MAKEIEVRVFKVASRGQIKAFAQITLLGKFVVRNFKVMEGERGLWVGMPALKDPTGGWRDIFFPITKEAREEIINAILDEYKKEEPAPSKVETPQEKQEQEPEQKPEA